MKIDDIIELLKSIDKRLEKLESCIDGEKSLSVYDDSCSRNLIDVETAIIEK
jgi:hypothetical protein